MQWFRERFRPGPSDHDPRQPVPTPLDEETVFDLLGNERRRTVVDCLTEPGADAPAWDLDRLAGAVAQYEVIGTPTTDQHTTVYVSLYQTHVPRLADAGALDVVETNASGGPAVVRAGTALGQLQAALRAVRRDGGEA